MIGKILFYDALPYTAKIVQQHNKRRKLNNKFIGKSIRPP